MADLAVDQSTRERLEAEQRKRFIRRMERKLAFKAALHRNRRQQFRARLQRLREW